MEFYLPKDSPLFVWVQPKGEPFRYYLCDKTKETCTSLQTPPSNTLCNEFVIRIPSQTPQILDRPILKFYLQVR